MSEWGCTLDFHVRKKKKVQEKEPAIIALFDFTHRCLYAVKRNAAYNVDLNLVRKALRSSPQLCVSRHIFH